MGFSPAGPLSPLAEDPDDYRPNSSWRLATDPGAPGVPMTTLFEECAVGDRVPLHRHEVDEMIIVLEGSDEVRVGDEVRVAGPGDTVFVPAGVKHSQRNAGDVPLKIIAVFPSAVLDIEMLERNPMPGTEDQPPMRSVYDPRTGEFTVLGPSRLD